MIAAVFDAMVFLQAAAKRAGPARACFDLVDAGQVTLFVSPPILEEVRDVLNRPAIRRSFPKLTDEHVQAFLEHTIETAQAVESVPIVERLDRDPDDEAYLNLALAANASFLVTRDKDLLSLMDDAAFRTQHPALSIVDPVTFLQHVRAQQSGSEPT